LLLVRHGESQVQVDGVVGGPIGCRGLSDRGRLQVEALRRRWEERPVGAEVLVSSSLPRAVETAELLVPALGSLPVLARDDLHEVDPGESDALSWEEFGRRYRPTGWVYDPNEPMAPGGESWVGFSDRVSAALRELTERHAGATVVVACHGGVVAAAMHHFLGLAPTAPYQWRITNASVTEWVWEAPAWGDRTPRWHLARFNDAAHLEGEDA
jgi:broad specificity phosphatase PhoE